LQQGTDGSFYGLTEAGGNDSCYLGCGVVFRLSVGLGEFVRSPPTAGAVGAAVKILGTDLAGATSVTFNGRIAAFTVVSATEISTNVPVGATSGQILVATPGATLSSNAVFQVLP
jgi:hypothetical protein